MVVLGGGAVSYERGTPVIVVSLCRRWSEAESDVDEASDLARLELSYTKFASLLLSSPEFSDTKVYEP